DKQRIDALYRRRLQSLQAVDRGVAKLVDTLQRTGELDNTYVVFSSDNGFHLGDHRMPAGKGTAYDTDVRVPLYVRGPGVESGSHVGKFAVNVDLAPTFAAWAHVEPADSTDGRALAPLLGRGAPPSSWRTRVLLEHWREESSGEGGVTEPS